MRDSSHLLHLRSTDVSLVVDARGDGVPSILYWGRDLGDLDDEAVGDLARAAIPQIASNSLDALVPTAVLPEQARGWAGAAGIEGHRDGTDFSLDLRRRDVRRRSVSEGRVRERVEIDLGDDHARVSVLLEIHLLHSGLVRVRARLSNDATAPYTLNALRTALPIPTRAQEILDFAGRHMRESAEQRHRLTVGTHAREGRRGRTGHDASLLYATGERGFGFGSGEIWAVQTAWSGNHRTYAERLANGRGVVGGEELLLPGEIVLERGASYVSPWLYGSYGLGLDEVSARFHEHLRARPQHDRGDRLVALNTWEAVYFDQDATTLTTLASRAAEIGVERFVLDDGWFLNRRSKRAGLGDWQVDPAIWPEGLHPLVDHVRGLGMQFGLWFEPEMISPDSRAARAHPEWIMSPGHRLPPTARHQQVLDLANPAAFDHVFSSMSSLIEEYDVDFVKWDHNRDLVDAGHPQTGRAGVHDQTVALYRLIDDLRERFPRLEIESCSSGGARADLEILDRVDRVWASDCIDALERQRIERWMGLTVPPEMLGSHVGAPLSHSTGRQHGLGFRAGTALFGSFGIEWDLTRASQEELALLAEWVRAYKELRPLLHSGRVVRSDHPDPSFWVRGVVAHDRREAVYAFVSVATGVWTPPGMVQLPGLDPDVVYEVSSRPPGDAIHTFNDHSGPPWWTSGLVLTGAALSRAGMQAPALAPERLALIHVRAVGTEPEGEE